MPYQTVCNASPKKEILEDLKELKALVENLPDHLGDGEFKTQIFEIVDQIQDIVPYTSHAPALRKLVAHFGDAYYFFNKTGDSCFLADFLSSAKSLETLISSE
jgi:hypothetical protein